MKRFLAIALIVFSFVACKPIDEQINIHDYTLENPNNVALGLSQLSLDTKLLLDADNNSGLNIVLTDLSASLFNKNGKKVADIALGTKKGEKKPTLHRKTSEQVEIPLKVDFDNPLSALTLLAMSVDDFGEKGYTVDYDLTLKAGCLKKRFSENEVPVKELVKKLQQ